MDRGALHPRALAARAILTPIAKRMERAAFDPRPAQESALKRVLRECARSELGARFGLDRVTTLDDLKTLPATDYEDVREASERVQATGARGVFGTSALIAFSVSSGTTGAPKRYPVTRAVLASYRRVMLALQACILTDAGEWGQLTRGKQILLANSGDIERVPCGLPCGHMSGVVLSRAPRWMRGGFFPSDDVMRERDWETKLRRLLDESRREDVRIVGAFPSGLKSLTERALEHFGVRTLTEVWPNLRAVFFGGAPMTEAARASLTRAWCGDAITAAKLHFWENYSSAEAMFGHSFRSDWPGLAFSPFESVFLFRLAESPDEPRWLRLDELDEGMRVQVFVTNPGGLVNYRMNDVITITSRRPLTFRFAGRTFDQVSLAAERITTLDADEAFSAWARGAGGAPIDFVLWIEEGRPSRIVWGAPLGADRGADAAVAASLDRALRARNVQYDRLRASSFYGDARIEPIDARVFRAYRARHLHVGVFKEKKIFQDRAAFEREYGL